MGIDRTVANAVQLTGQFSIANTDNQFLSYIASIEYLPTPGPGGGGSGSGTGSGSNCGFCSATPAVPVLLQLINNLGGITNLNCANCAALNANFILQHSNDTSLSCCWFSGPIEFCGANPGYWKLEKTDATNWVLLLLLTQLDGSAAEVVRYTVASLSNACTFPITLARTSISVNDACANWPLTLTITPAP